MSDLNVILGEDGTVTHTDQKPIEKASEGLSPNLVTLGDAARFAKERKELAQSSSSSSASPTSSSSSTTATSSSSSGAPASSSSSSVPASSSSSAKKKVAVEVAEPLERLVDKAVEKRIAESRTAEAKPVSSSSTAPDPDQAYIDGLPEEMQEEIALAERAEKEMPDKYKGAKAKMISALRKTDEFIAEKRRQNPEWDPDEDESYSSFVEENSFSINRKDRRTIQNLIVTEEAERRVMAKIAPKLEEAERVTRASEMRPAVEQTMENFSQFVEGVIAPENAPIAKADDGLAKQYREHYANQSKRLAKLYLEVSTGLTKVPEYDAKQSPNAKSNLAAVEYSALQSFIQSQEMEFLKNGGDARIKDGKRFAPRAIYEQLTPQEKSGCWTTDNGLVLEMIAFSSAEQAKSAFEAEQKRLKDAGYSPGSQASKTEKEKPSGETKTRDGSPNATPTPAPGLAQSTPPPGPQPFMTEAEVKRQLSPGVSRWV